jgi:hypothetical protein
MARFGRPIGMRVLLVLPLLLLTACAVRPGSGSAGAQPSDGGSASSSAAERPQNELRITIDRGDGSEPERYTLVCSSGVAGSHPDPQAACKHLARLDEPFAAIPADAVCTQVYGGPQTARVTGVWAGAPVDLELSRVDGCRIAQWDKLGPVLPGHVGAEPPR